MSFSYVIGTVAGLGICLCTAILIVRFVRQVRSGAFDATPAAGHRLKHSSRRIRMDGALTAFSGGVFVTGWICWGWQGPRPDWYNVAILLAAVIISTAFVDLTILFTRIIRDIDNGTER